jgi:hypothetical protein
MTQNTHNSFRFSPFITAMEIALTLVVSIAVVYGLYSLNDLPMISV